MISFSRTPVTKTIIFSASLSMMTRSLWCSRGCSIAWLPRIAARAASSGDEGFKLSGPGLQVRNALVVLEFLDRLEEVDDMMTVAAAELAAVEATSASRWVTWWRYGGLASRTPGQVTFAMTKS